MTADGAERLPPWAVGGDHGRIQLSAEVRERHQRDRVIAALARLVHDGKEPGATQILAAAGMSRAGLYKLFGSKGALFDAACLEATRELVDPIRAAGELEEPWPERLAAAVGALVGAVGEEPLMAELCLVHAPFLVGTRVDAGPAAVRAALLEALEGGRTADGVGDPPPCPSTEVFVAGGIVAGLEWAVRHERLGGIGALRASLVELAAEPFLGREAARNLARGVGKASTPG